MNALGHRSRQEIGTLGRFGRVGGETADFVGNDAESFALLPGAGGFHRCVQCKQLGLTRDLLDQRKECPNLIYGGTERIDRLGAGACVVGQHFEGAGAFVESGAVFLGEAAKPSLPA